LNEVVIPRDILNRLVMNYLMVEGYQQASQKFAKESGQKGTHSSF